MVILLTGAGFSRNWGGWLANEAFEYLLGSSYIDDLLRQRLWIAKERTLGFEDVLAELQTEHEARWLGQTEQDFRNLTSSVTAMFAEMATGYHNLSFENERDPKIRTFLSRFDAIYTLNQDTLIEQKYAAGLPGTDFRGCDLPGIKPEGSALRIGQTNYHLHTPDPDHFALPSGKQPYLKLHGSFNWVHDQRNSLLILGGNKEANIKKFPLLVWYHQLFRADLTKQGARLLIIGYSFNDPHINKAITEAIAVSDLRIFIIDPLGVDVFDKRDQGASIRQPPTELMDQLSPRIVGASRRQLRQTFENDVLEHAKVMKFFG